MWGCNWNAGHCPVAAGKFGERVGKSDPVEGGRSQGDVQHSEQYSN
jgi:hypothetical protein